MAYTINKTNGQQLVSLLDGTINDKYQVKLVGKNYINYGTAQNENFIYLLENFANDTAPLYPLTGQLWYNTSSNSISYYDGVTFSALANVNQLSSGVTTLEANLIANVASLQSQITANAVSTSANAAAQAFEIYNLWANATVQNDQIALINSNIDDINSNIADMVLVDTSLSTRINSTNGNVTAANSAISGLQTHVTNLWSNAAVQSGQITAIQNAGYLTSTNLVPYALLNSPALTGTPTATTPSTSDNSTKIATTEFVVAKDNLARAYTDYAVNSAVTNLSNTLTPAVNARAPLNSPALTGTPTAPTALVSDVSTKIATTAFVRSATQYWDGSRKFVSTNTPDSGQGSDGDFWFQYQ